MMEQIRQLSAKIQPIRTTGGVILLDEFELRAAVFGARTSIDLERYEIRKAPKNETSSKRRVANAKLVLQQNVFRKDRLVGFLENELKRANRILRSAVGPIQFKTLSDEWRSHLRWIGFHLTYFKPPPKPGTGRLNWRRQWSEILVQMAENAIVESGYELPNSEELRAVLHQFLDYSLRGRIGEFNHIYMTRNSDSPAAQLKLLAFIGDRLFLRRRSDEAKSKS
jgi:hypothetical protein